MSSECDVTTRNDPIFTIKTAQLANLANLSDEGVLLSWWQYNKKKIYNKDTLHLSPSCWLANLTHISIRRNQTSLLNDLFFNVKILFEKNTKK